MLPAKAELLARYQKKEVEADKFGRLITVVRLRLSESISIRRMAETEDDTALIYMLAAAAVRAVDDIAYPFPRNITDLNATIDALDQEGMEAALEASVKLRITEEQETVDPKASPTPNSGSSAS